MIFRFVIKPPLSASFERTLQWGESLVIGRGSKANCRPDDPSLSRRHCCIEVTQQGPSVEDLGSANGTLVNGQEIKRVILSIGDKIAVGGTMVEYHSQQQVGSGAMMAPGRPSGYPSGVQSGAFSSNQVPPTQHPQTQRPSSHFQSAPQHPTAPPSGQISRPQYPPPSQAGSPMAGAPSSGANPFVNPFAQPYPGSQSSGAHGFVPPQQDSQAATNPFAAAPQNPQAPPGASPPSSNPFASGESHPFQRPPSGAAPVVRPGTHPPAPSGFAQQRPPSRPMSAPQSRPMSPPPMTPGLDSTPNAALRPSPNSALDPSLDPSLAAPMAPASGSARVPVPQSHRLSASGKSEKAKGPVRWPVRLELVPPYGSPFDFCLFPGQSCSIGKGQNAQIRLDDPNLDDVHLAFAYSEGGLELLSQSQFKRQRANGQRVEGSEPLVPGDRIELGRTAVVVGRVSDKDRSHPLTMICDRCKKTFKSETWKAQAVVSQGENHPSANGCDSCDLKERLQSVGIVGDFEVTRVFRPEEFGLDSYLISRQSSPPSVFHVVSWDADPEKLQAFQSQLHKLALASSPNKAKSIQLFMTPRAVVLEEEWVAGQDLRSCVEEFGALSQETIFSVAEQGLSCLKDMHDQGLYDLDLRPENFRFGEYHQTELKMVAFGLSYVQRHISRDHKMGWPETLPPWNMPGFLAPELLRAPREVGPHTDLYGLGATLYFLACERAPYPTQSLVELMQQQDQSRPRPLSEANTTLPRALGQFIDRLMARDPMERVADARTALHMLRSLKS
ncbi:MAG: FHA domain-containing protein [Planctomycetota bacterium]|nr:FHA domain-containing protein [Planctomycetota bacterium]